MKYAVLLCTLLAACGGGASDEPSRAPYSFEKCQVKLDDRGFCPESELTHQVPNGDKICKGYCL